MMAKRKIEGHGKFGSRYGKKIRERALKVEKKAKKLYKCPNCSRVAVKRLSNGVWQCQKCGKKFASGAFEFKVD